MGIRLVIFIICICISKGEKDLSPSQRIVGGSITTIERYPYAAALLYSQSQITFSQWCGGIIINTRSILTAASCLESTFVYQMRTRLGSSSSSIGGLVYTLARYTLHPSYNRLNFDSDIAVIHVSSIISFGSSIRAASIAGANYYLGDNEPIWAVGWGSITQGGVSSDQLRHVQVWTVNQVLCRSRYAAIGNTVTDNMFCSGWLDVGGRGQCQGDSGGPIVHNNNVTVGVSSWARGCALAAYPSVNTRISRFTSWIVSIA